MKHVNISFLPNPTVCVCVSVCPHAHAHMLLVWVRESDLRISFALLFIHWTEHLLCAITTQGAEDTSVY